MAKGKETDLADLAADVAQERATATAATTARAAADAAQAEVGRLVAERDKLPDELQAAINATDLDAVARLTHRQAELPNLIRALCVRRSRLELDALEARAAEILSVELPPLQAQLPELEARVSEARAALAAAEAARVEVAAKVDAVSSEYWRASAEAERIRDAFAERDRPPVGWYSPGSAEAILTGMPSSDAIPRDDSWERLTASLAQQQAAAIASGALTGRAAAEVTGANALTEMRAAVGEATTIRTRIGHPDDEPEVPAQGPHREMPPFYRPDR